MRTPCLLCLLATTVLAGCDAPAKEPCDDSAGCACVPLRCSELGDGCGTLDDGCGATIDCGCVDGSSCDGGHCVSCTPVRCAEQGLECGETSDRCGTTLDCGSCSAPESCGGAGVAGVCGCTEEAACAGRCGSVQSCGAQHDCGGCTEGSCHPEAGVCVAELRPYCFGTPVEWTALGAVAAEPIRGGTVTLEGEQRWLTFVSAFRHYRVLLADDGVSLAGPIQPLGTSSVPEMYVGPPQVRSDGLELTFTAVDELGTTATPYLAARADLSLGFGAPVALQLGPGWVTSLLLLEDRRTLLSTHAMGGGAGVLRVSRRATTTPGDTSFELVEDLPGGAPRGPGDEIGGLTSGCDGVSVLFGWIFEPGADVGVRTVTSLEPLTLSPAVLAPQLPLDPGSFGAGLFVSGEAPGCERLYLGDYTRLYVAERVPCP